MTRSEAQGAQRQVGVVLGRADALNLALLLTAFVLVLLIVPPVRAFPIHDDWAYAHPIDGLLRLDYERYPWSQAWAVSHEVWGSLFTLILGSGYTTLSIANLVISSLCVVVFYFLLRYLAVGPTLAVLGAALLQFHPVFFNFSYSFMTDITFLCMLLLACLLFVRAAQTGGDFFLWTGSIAAALALLTRQFGIAVVVVMLAYLWWQGNLLWRRGLAVAAVPVLAGAAYLLWERGQPTPLIDYFMQQDVELRASKALGSLAPRLIMTARVLSVCCLFLIPLTYRTRTLQRPLLLGVLLSFLLVPLVVMFDTVYPYLANAVDNTGFGFCCGTSLPIWNEAVWASLAVIGAFSAAFLMVGAAERVRPAELRATRLMRNSDPVHIVLLTSTLLGVAIVVFPLAVLDRYMLPVVMAFILFGCRQLERVGVTFRGKVLRYGLLLPVVLFSVAAEHDYMQNRAVRWAAAEKLVSQGVPHDHIDAGYEWGGEYVYDKVAEQLRASGTITAIEWPPDSMTTPTYVISEYALADYNIVEQRQFTSWLEPWRTRTVLVQKQR